MQYTSLNKHSNHRIRDGTKLKFTPAANSKLNDTIECNDLTKSAQYKTEIKTAYFMDVLWLGAPVHSCF